MNIIVLIICYYIIFVIILSVKLYESNIMSFFSGNNRNVIVPVRNIIVPIENAQLKKEIELTPMKKYVIIQSPDQHFSIGIEVEPLNI